MTKRKLGCLISLSISVLIFGMIAWHAREVVYAAESSTQTSLQDATSTDATSTNTTSTDATSSETVSTDTASTDTTSSDTISVAAATTDASSSDASVPQPSQISGNNWIYDVDTPLDLYGSDESTTTEIQTVAPESSFEVTYVQDDNDLVSVMTSVLSSLGTDTIDQCSQSLKVYFLLPSDVDTSGIGASSFTLGGFYSLFTIDDVSQEQIDPYTLLTLSFTSKTSYSSVTSLLSAWQENTEGEIVLSGLSVPSTYTLGTVFYVSALPQGTVNVPIGNTVYQFEAIPDPSAGNDAIEVSIGSEADSFLAHVTFKVAETTTEETTETTTEETTEAATEETTEAATEETTEASTEETTEASTEDTTTGDTATEDTTTEETTDAATVETTLYDAITPIDLYGSDAATTTEIQTVAPESSFEVTYTQDDSDLVNVMASVLSSLDTTSIDAYSGSLSVSFILPNDVDTSGVSASSFTLGGFYSLFGIDEVSQEQIDSYTRITLSVSPKTTYSSVESLLSAWQENAEGEIILSGLAVPSSYSLGDLFYVSALPQGTVNVQIGDMIYQFEAIPNPSAGDDGMTETYSDSQTDGYRAHVAFQLGITDISSNDTSNTTSDDSSDTASDDSSNTTSDDDSSDTASGDSSVTASETQTASTASSSTEPDTEPATVPTAAPDDTEDQKGNAVEGELPETGEQSQGSAFGAVFFAPLLLLLMVLAERRRHY